MLLAWARLVRVFGRLCLHENISMPPHTKPTTDITFNKNDSEGIVKRLLLRERPTTTRAIPSLWSSVRGEARDSDKRRKTHNIVAERKQGSANGI